MSDGITEAVYERFEKDMMYTNALPKDGINPKYYKAGKVECIDALEAATMNLSGIEAVCTANVIKYLWRWKEKGGKDDLQKAQWYITKLLTHIANS